MKKGLAAYSLSVHRYLKNIFRFGLTSNRNHYIITSQVDSRTQPNIIGWYFMNGLKYIREKFNMSLTDLAARLNISRQAVSKWEQEGDKGKPISPKKLKELSAIFDLPEEYFGEIAEKKKTEIDQHIINDAAEKSELYFNDLFCDEEDNLRFIRRTNVDKSIITNRYNEIQLAKKQLLQKIDKIVSGKKKENLNTIYEEVEHIEKYIRLFNKFSNIVEQTIYCELLFDIIRAIEIIKDKQDSKLDKSLTKFLSDESAFINNLVNLISTEYEHEEAERKKRRELRREVKIINLDSID